MGLISQDVVFEGPADDIFETEERDGGAYWYGRIFRHCYDVRWYFGWEGEPEYGCSLDVDTLTGKIMAATLYSVPNADDEPVDEVEIEGENGPKTLYYYDIFDHIIPADMTVDRFCTLLAEYWGFSGYRISDTVEDEYYHEYLPAVDGSTLLLDLADRSGNRYVTVFFEGDQPGVPMYIQLNQFPGYVSLMVGTVHAVG